MIFVQATFTCKKEWRMLETNWNLCKATTCKKTTTLSFIVIKWSTWKPSKFSKFAKLVSGGNGL